jgi:hypothetical protein
MQRYTLLKIVIAGLNQKFLYWHDEESGKERKTSMYFLVQANDVKEALITQWESCKSTMGEYSIPAVSNLLLWMFFLIFLEKKKIWKRKSLIKAARPEVAVDTEILWNLPLKRKLRPKIYIQISTKNSLIINSISVFKIGDFLVNTKLLMLVCKRETLALAGTLCFIVGMV